MKMRAMQIPAPGGKFELVERDIPIPGRGEVCLRVQACGVCHSDALVREGHWPGIAYPRIPGHEVVGIIDSVGTDVFGFAEGQRVGVGWYGGHCGICNPCRRGQFILCRSGRITGIHSDGGYADYMVVSQQALARVPEKLTPAEAGPLLCAGITTFNSLRNAGARAPDLVAVLGIGGLGHLGIQFAAKMGFHTVAIARGKDKEALARQLGAHAYIDSQSQDPAQALQKLGGAKVILATATSAPAMSAVLGGLGIDGKLLVLGADPTPMAVNGLQLLSNRASVQGWPSGTAVDSEDTLAFSALTGVRSMNEVFPLERAAEAYERMMSGAARFRVVLTMT